MDSVNEKEQKATQYNLQYNLPTPETSDAESSDD